MSRGKKGRSPVSPVSGLVKTKSITHSPPEKRNNESIHADNQTKTIEMPMNDDLASERMEAENDEWHKVTRERSNKIQKTNPKNSVTTCPMSE